MAKREQHYPDFVERGEENLYRMVNWFVNIFNIDEYLYRFMERTTGDKVRYIAAASMVRALWATAFATVAVSLSLFASPLALAAATIAFTALAPRLLQHLRQKIFLPIVKKFARFYLSKVLKKTDADVSTILRDMIDERTVAQQFLDYFGWSNLPAKEPSQLMIDDHNKYFHLESLVERCYTPHEIRSAGLDMLELTEESCTADSRTIKNYGLLALIKKELEKEQQNKIAKHQSRWASLVKFALTGYFLGMVVTSSLTLIAGLTLSSPAVFAIWTASILFGGTCGALSNQNAFTEGLMSLNGLTDEKKKELLGYGENGERPSLARRLYNKTGWLSNKVNGAAAAATTFYAAFMMASAITVGANAIYLLPCLAFAGFCSYGVYKAYSSLGEFIWITAKKRMQGLFWGPDGDGNPVGLGQRIAGISSLVIAVVVPVALAILNAKDGAELILDLFARFGSAKALAIGSLSGIAILSGPAMFMLYFACITSSFRQIGKLFDNNEEQAAKSTIAHDLTEEELKIIQAQTYKQVFEDHKLSQQVLEARTQYTSKLDYIKKRFTNIERKLLMPSTVVANGIGNGAITAAIVTCALQGGGPVFAALGIAALPGVTIAVIAVFAGLFVGGAIASMSTLSTAWCKGMYSREDVYPQIRELTEQALIYRTMRDKQQPDSAEYKQFEQKQADCYKEIENLKSYYNPHALNLFYNGVMHIISGLAAMIATPMLLAKDCIYGPVLQNASANASHANHGDVELNHPTNIEGENGAGASHYSVNSGNCYAANALDGIPAEPAANDALHVDTHDENNQVAMSESPKPSKSCFAGFFGGVKQGSNIQPAKAAEIRATAMLLKG